MQTNYFTYAVPVFIGAMLLEAAVTAWKRKPVYGITDSFTNIACGMGSQLAGLYFAAMTLGIYAYVYEHRLVDLAPSGWVAWVLALLGVDLAYYWYHRLSHEVNVLWATHVVHHQSEEYNLSVALRQSWFSGVYSWVFYIPLAVLGVPPALYAISYSINLLYQFIIHTRTVKTLGPLEAVLNTPSHHRVHHGSNIAYLDKNYAGVLIIWDRMFGTFTTETEDVEYGLVKPLHSFNPLWANVVSWVDLARASASLPGLGNKLKIWVKNPGWLPGDRSPLDAIERSKGRVYRKHELKAPLPAAAYVFLQFLATIAGTVAVMALGQSLDTNLMLLIYGFAVTSMALWQGLLLGKSWAVACEGLRLVVLAGAAGMLAASPLYPVAASAAMAFFLVASVAALAGLYASSRTWGNRWPNPAARQPETGQGEFALLNR